ncbi:hypothetical protein [Aquimarina litoralis]|uniref:hypothetical protein n=1 Tax=Aquimarina litoralis TaxID=584605 RepID=UPI001C57388C|nr:hypothetical protein [Aquimarina litoralis]MBW1298377.1 hypothetical protein [Aquimarina litoralis]
MNITISDFSRTELMQVREAHHGAIRLIRRAYYMLHDFITPGRILSSRQRQLVENSLFASFLSNSSNIRAHTHISNYDMQFRLIHLNLQRLHRHASHFEVHRLASALDGDDFIRGEGASIEIYAESVGVHSHRRIPVENRPYIILYDPFFSTSYSNRLRIIIHELCHNILGFTNPRSFRNPNVHSHSNDIYITNWNVFNAMSFAQSIRNPDKHAYFILLLSEITLEITNTYTIN